MSHTSHTRHARRPHRQPICEHAQKRRFRDGKDARLAIREAARVRAAAAITGGDCAWVVTRSYRCEDCNGFHLTSRPSWSAESESRIDRQSREFASRA